MSKNTFTLSFMLQDNEFNTEDTSILEEELRDKIAEVSQGFIHQFTETDVSHDDNEVIITYELK